MEDSIRFLSLMLKSFLVIDTLDVIIVVKAPRIKYNDGLYQASLNSVENKNRLKTKSAR